MLGAFYLAELHPTQPLSQPLLSESGPLSGRAREGELLAPGFCLGEQTGGAGLQEKTAARGGLLPDAVRTPVLQVSGFPASSAVQVGHWWTGNFLPFSLLLLLPIICLDRTK